MNMTYTYQQVTLQHTATHCNALQHTATHCNTHEYECEYIFMPHVMNMSVSEYIHRVSKSLVTRSYMTRGYTHIHDASREYERRYRPSINLVSSTQFAGASFCIGFFCWEIRRKLRSRKVDDRVFPSWWTSFQHWALVGLCLSTPTCVAFDHATNERVMSLGVA